MASFEGAGQLIVVGVVPPDLVQWVAGEGRRRLWLFDFLRFVLFGHGLRLFVLFSFDRSRGGHRLKGRLRGGTCLALIDPAVRQLPDFDGLVFAACDQLLELLVPPHLRDGAFVSVDRVKRGSLLHVPDGQITFFVTSDDLAALISPEHQPLLRATIHLYYFLR